MYTFQLQPAQPDMAQLRAQCAASVNYTPLSVASYFEQDAFMQAEIDERGGYEYAELTLEDKRELIAVGDLCAYTYPGYPFEGTVLELDADTDRARLRFEDQFGVRSFWCALDCVELVLKREAAALESAVR